MAKTSPEWRNRIVDQGVKPAKDFLANPSNFRRHPNNQRDATRSSLKELGWIQQVIENKQTGNLIDGHLRIEEALSKNENEPIPYLLVDLSPEEEKLALALVDPISALAVTDKEALDLLLKDVSTGDAALQAMLSELAAKEGIIPPDFQPVGIEEQGRLDEKAKVTCPECGAQF